MTDGPGGGYRQSHPFSPPCDGTPSLVRQLVGRPVGQSAVWWCRVSRYLLGLRIGVHAWVSFSPGTPTAMGTPGNTSCAEALLRLSLSVMGGSGAGLERAMYTPSTDEVAYLVQRAFGPTRRAWLGAPPGLARLGERQSDIALCACVYACGARQYAVCVCVWVTGCGSVQAAGQ
ncbi:hypothetical protein B0I35DRAFT_232982 [Stachybotrys elegans]|uniref:Uncharacterized protein n=1 Tax=Stachybotrys elegans TaxID=80388 RepID=A0A8K0STQ0_9HYPO|nr:hypothetical protein B0I35DRAFT_232982 [Stachybotrys elegans]